MDVNWYPMISDCARALGISLASVGEVAFPPRRRKQCAGIMSVSSAGCAPSSR
jgi:hypothetical protein